ncbi:hypothetical protein ACERII_24650 [Evansella sp. AB-rgal1]|uniref:hypothetical protein n=1 Tax=Evansella sp. AB-rgal1 TaxID=3242696 RepID=UPI00359CF246
MDVMGEFKIKHDHGVYVLPFQEHSVTFHFVKGVKVPFCKLEDWYILYQLIPDREEKVKKIENYLTRTGFDHTELLQRSLANSLPEKVKVRIQKLLANVE